MPPDYPENKHSPLLGVLNNRLTVMETRFEESNKTLFAGINELKGAISELVKGIGGANEQSVKSREELIRIEAQIDRLREKYDLMRDEHNAKEKELTKKISNLETKVWRITAVMAVVITTLNIGGGKLLSLLS